MPATVLQFNNVTQSEGQSVEMTCEVEGDPTPKISMFRLTDFGEKIQVVNVSCSVSFVSGQIFLDSGQFGRLLHFAGRLDLPVGFCYWSVTYRWFSGIMLEEAGSNPAIALVSLRNLREQGIYAQ